MGKIIITTGIKGGTGKTQICATAATFLLECGYPVYVIDADIQQSLSRHYQRDLEARPNADKLWPVYFLDTSDIEHVKDIIGQVKKFNCIILIDCPGNINDPALQYIFEAADVAIVPFEYNSDVVDATVMFGEVLKENFFQSKKKRIFFIPNKVSAVWEKQGAVRKAREDAYELLIDKRHLGWLTPEIRMTTLMNGYSSLDFLGYEKRKVVRDAFAPIVKFLKIGS